MSRKHFTKVQQRGNGWLDPRGTKEAHEKRDMTNRKLTKRDPKVTRLQPQPKKRKAR